MDINSIIGQMGNIAQLKTISVKLGSAQRGSGLTEVANIINSAQTGNISGVVQGVSTLANSLSSGGAGLTINRDGSVTGSLAGGSITLAGGSLDWQGALNQVNTTPYITRAQKTVLASMVKYIETMTDAHIDKDF